MTEGMTYAEFGQLITGAMGMFLLGLAGYGAANLRFRVPGTATFVALSLAAAMWCFGYVAEKAQTLPEGFFWAARIEYLGLAFLPPLWLLVSLSWIDHPWAKSLGLRVGLLSVSVVLIALVWTNDLHHGWYSAIVPTGREGFARFAPGVLYYPFFTLMASCFVVGSLLLLWHQRNTLRHVRRARIVLVTNVFPLFFSAAYQLGLRPGGLDLTIFSLVPAFALLTFGLVRHDLVRLVPVARDLVVESLEERVLVHDELGRLVDHNAAAGKNLARYEEALNDTTQPGGEVRVVGDEGARVFRFRRTPIRGSGGQVQGTVTILSDVTEERRLMEQLAHEATHDPLTGVANRRHFEEHAMGEITRARRHGGTLALVLFDLDHFKSVNDRFGHQAGDQVLKATVAEIGARLRRYDLLARLGGEEFAVLMPEASPVEAREAAERWRAALETTRHSLPSGVTTVTASFGVATLNDLALDLADTSLRFDALLGLADRALYHAKSTRNRVC